MEVDIKQENQEDKDEMHEKDEEEKIYNFHRYK